MKQLLFQSHGGFDLCGAMDAFVGNFIQPAGDFDIGCDDIKLESALVQATGERHIKGAPQIAIETLDLAFGLGAVRAAQFDDEAAMFGAIQKAGMKPVLTLAVVALMNCCHTAGRH